MNDGALLWEDVYTAQTGLPDFDRAAVTAIRNWWYGSALESIRREEVSQNTSLTGVPVKVGQTLKNYSIFSINEKILGYSLGF